MVEKYFDYSSLVITATVVAVGATVYETRKVHFKIFILLIKM